MENMNTEKNQEELTSTTPKATTSNIPDWDHDLQVIPRLQVVDEHQKFT